MQADNTHGFEPEHLRMWWQATRDYLYADLESLPGPAAQAEDERAPPETDAGRKRYTGVLWIGLCAGMLTGCASGPDFKPPAAPDVAGYTVSTLSAQTVAAPTALGGAQRFVAGVPVAAQWWRQFGSARLDALIEVALRASPTLEAAQATLRQARQNWPAQHGIPRRTPTWAPSAKASTMPPPACPAASAPTTCSTPAWR